jgi:hypothetical protein
MRCVQSRQKQECLLSCEAKRPDVCRMSGSDAETCCWSPVCTQRLQLAPRNVMLKVSSTGGGIRKVANPNKQTNALEYPQVISRLKTATFCSVTLCCLADCQRFRETHCLHLQGWKVRRDADKSLAFPSSYLLLLLSLLLLFILTANGY